MNMKVADVYYEGRTRRHSRRGPSDVRYRWQRTTTGAPENPAEVHEVEDALYFEDNSVFRVEWTPLGRLAAGTEDAAAESGDALSALTYRAKQRAAKALGVKANQKEDELDEALRPEIERLQEQMEAGNL